MEPKPLNDMQRYLLDEEIENLQQGRVERREFLHRAAFIVGSGAASSILLSLGCKGRQEAADGGTLDAGGNTAPGAVRVPDNDPAIQTSTVEIPHRGGDFKLSGYLSAPATVPQGAATLLVIHENRALTPYIKDVVRRWAKAGYVALCVDLLSRLGGTEKFPDEGARPGALGQITPEQGVADLSAGLDYLKGRPNVNSERTGVTGFCFGGGYTWRMATQRADLRAAVAFYGPNPPLADVPAIKAAVLGIYGGLDSRITSAVPELEAALKTAKVTYEIKIYDGAEHAFHNDTGTRYKADAALDAWQRAVAWFARYV
jgi:carboxymethylenebutenolidase